MSAPAALRVGWCPGALRPMLAGDGLLVRIKPRGNRLPVGTCAHIAELALRYGNGMLGITGRGNLQMRGVAAADLDAVTVALSRLDLLDPTPEGEAVRNVLSSPLAGHDSAALLDVRPVVGALEERLATDPFSWRLPPKFAWLVDDGGSLPLDDVAADVRFTAVAGESGLVFEVALDGGNDAAAECRIEDVPAVAGSLASAFLDLCAERGVPPHRMADLAHDCGAGAVLVRAGLDSAVKRPPRRGARAPIGLFRQGKVGHVGVAPPFGRLDARQFGRLANAADRAGAADVGVTPWRTLLVGGLSGLAAERLWAEFTRPGDSPIAPKSVFSASAEGGTSPIGLAAAPASPWITEPADSRLAIAACVGAPQCWRATTPVQEDAARLAAALPPALRSGITIHVSGCAKGCAHAGPAPLTFVAEDGHYDLVPNGNAADAPLRRGLRSDELVAIVTAPGQSS